MKKYTLSYKKVLFISAFLCVSFFYAQINVTYEVIYKPDSLKQVYNTERMSLKHFQGKSYFYNETKFQLDSIYDKATAIYQKTGSLPSVSLKYELNFGAYKDYNKKRVYDIQNINNKHFLYEVPYRKLNWKISNEYKQVLKYNCRKASIKWKGREWDVWFTEDIPIQDGPYLFYGLPGLILEAMDKNKDYHFYSIAIKKETEKIRLPSVFIRTNKKKFNEFKQKLIKDPAVSTRKSISKRKNIRMLDTNGNEISPNDLYQKITKEFNDYLTSHNNHIMKGYPWIR